MHEEAVRLARLLDDLARFYDAERPGPLLEKTPIDLAGVARSAFDSFAPRFADARLALDAALEPAWLLGDREGGSIRSSSIFSRT